jgi:hypothetical protein
MKHKLIFLYTVLLFLVQTVSAQYYETGQDPASLKWMQIKTGKFTVIYPEKYGQEGIKYAKSFENSYSKLMSLFPEKRFKIPVVLHNYTIQSNGYVSWAPKRIELYPTPDQNSIPLAAETQLTVHELTHVLQMESLNHSFSKAASLFFGEQFTGIVASMLPSWFLEGDAVFAESVLTKSGRGRTPSFQKQLKALIVDNKPYNYDKILNGSYRDFVPDYYESGYQMVTFALAKNDPQIWNKVLAYTAEKPFTLNPVNISLSENYNLKKKKLWEVTSDTLKAIWTKDVIKNNPEEYETANPDKHGRYINYYSPIVAGSDSIIAIKTSLSYPSTFVLINSKLKTEKKIHTPGAVYPMFISYAKNKLVWVEAQNDPRWANREYSVIKLMDLKKNEVRKLSYNSRYLAASISTDGNRIAAVENTIKNTNSLVLIAASDGSVIESVNTPGNVYIQHPQWAADGKKVSFIFLTDAGEGIMSYNFASQQWETLIEPGRDDLQSSFLKNDSLIFISSSSGTDNIYLLTPDKKTMIVSRSRFGAIDVSPSGNKLIFSDYSALGNNICTTTLPVLSGTTKENSVSAAFLINRFNIRPQEIDTGSTIYTPQPYRKWQHLFRFHSWMPFYADIQTIQTDPASVRPGVTILTQNTLSTLTSTIGYEYSADRRNVLHSRIKWEGWYPVVETQLDYGTMPVIRKAKLSDPNPSNVQPGIDFLTTLSLPLQFQNGYFSQFVQPSVTVDYENRYLYLMESNTYDYGQTIFTARFFFSNYSRSAFRDIYPRWAQVIDFNYCFAPLDKNVYGSSISLKTAFYFPGLLPNSSLKLRVETENQAEEEYFYNNFSSLPRGYNNIFARKISFLSADYAMPLAYPDFNLASLLYIKRIRGGLFYDYAFGPGNSIYTESQTSLTPLYNTSETESLSSFGGSLLADFHILRIPFMISGGIQSAWKNFGDRPSIELLFNINLYGFTFGKRRL